MTLTTEDVATRLHLQPATVRGLARKGQLRGSFVGRRWLFTEADVQDFLDATSNRPTPAPVRRRRRRAAA